MKYINSFLMKKNIFKLHLEASKAVTSVVLHVVASSIPCSK